MRKAGRRERIPQGAGQIAGRSSDGRRDLWNEQRRHQNRIAVVLNQGQPPQALRVTVFVWIERVDEDARVDRVTRAWRRPRTPRPSGNTRGCGHVLAAHRREEADAAHSWTEATFEAPSCLHEGVPRGSGISVVGRLRGGLGWVKRQDYADGPAPMRHDVGRPRVPHLSHDTRRVRFQVSNADDPPRRSGSSGSGGVVPHATTLLHRTGNVKDGKVVSQ